MELNNYREHLDTIDKELLRLFTERMAIAGEIAQWKQQNSMPVLDLRREKEKLRAMEEMSPEDLKEYSVSLFSLMMELSRSYQNRIIHPASAETLAIEQALKETPQLFPETAIVACQGVEGAYQQIAVDRLFHHPQIDFYDSFDGVFEAVERGECEFGVIPVENSTAGSVTRVYDLMASHDFSIVRSCRLRIEHNLLVPPGTRKQDIRIVYSHEQAIRQCRGYLSSMPDCRVHICENTAMAAEKVASLGTHDVAAIASRDCASLYGLEIAERNIQDQSGNYTRFACIAKDLAIYPGADRSSLMLVTANEPGALFKVLARFYALDINLIKLESRPIPERDFEFKFYFDIECPAASQQFEQLMGSLEDVCEECRYLGSYSEVI